MEKTYVIKGKPQNNWLLVDVNEATLGRVATRIAYYLLGKHKPEYTPGVGMGDFVVVINAQRVSAYPERMEEKFYHGHSGYPGGLKTTSLKDMLKNHPDRVIRSAVWGMLPHNKLGRQLIKRLKIYPGNEHPHEAQNPQTIDLKE